MNEFWAPVPEFDAYEVSTLGNVRRVRDGRPLKPTIYSGRYMFVSLYRDGEEHKRLVHRLVLMAHVGLPREPGMHARHLNGDKRDNRLSNLAWGTAKENKADQFAHGTVGGAHAGSNHHNSKLTEEQVAAIFRMRAEGYLQKRIAQLLGVTQSNVSKILAGKSRVSEDANHRAGARI